MAGHPANERKRFEKSDWPEAPVGRFQDRTVEPAGSAFLRVQWSRLVATVGRSQAAVSEPNGFEG